MTRRIVLGVAGFMLILTGVLGLGAAKAHEKKATRHAVAMLHEESGYLGVTIRDVRKEDVADLSLPAERGAYIETVEAESPAEEAGLREGDVVLEYAGESVSSVRQLRRLVSETPAGREVQIGVRRDGSNVNLSAKIGERGRSHSWFGSDPEILIEKEILPRFDSDGPGIVFDGHDFEMIRKQPRLGIQVVELSGQMADFLGISGREGVLILEILPSTPAEEAGLRAGDVILAINGQQVSSPGELVRNISSGENTIELARDQQISSVSVRVEEEDSEQNQKLAM